MDLNTDSNIEMLDQLDEESDEEVNPYLRKFYENELRIRELRENQLNNEIKVLTEKLAFIEKTFKSLNNVNKSDLIDLKNCLSNERFATNCLKTNDNCLKCNESEDKSFTTIKDNSEEMAEYSDGSDAKVEDLIEIKTENEEMDVLNDIKVNVCLDEDIEVSNEENVVLIEDKQLSNEDKGISSEDNLVLSEQIELSTKDELISCKDNVVSCQDIEHSIEVKEISNEDKVVLIEENGISSEGNVVSSEDIEISIEVKEVLSAENVVLIEDKSISSEEQIKQYIRKTDKRGVGRKQYNCDFENCRKAFRELNKIKVHVKRHLGLREFKCDYNDCNYRGYDQSEVKKHVINVHSVRHKCDDCRLKFQFPIDLKTHLESDKHLERLQFKPYIRRNNNRFECGFGDCGHSSSKAYILRKHIKKHFETH